MVDPLQDETVESLTDFALGLEYADLDTTTLDRARRLIVDTIGCGLGGSQSPPARMARRLASRVKGDRPATVMVGGESTTPDLAAFANGVMIRYLDFNDTFIGAGGGAHPSDMLAPALAVAEYAGRTGSDLIVGLVVGYEVYCALGDAEPQPKAWDQATYAVVAASVMTSRMLGLGRMQTRNALALAVASHLSIGQIRAGQISQWKACAVPNAARNAIFCGLLAAEGMTGPDLPFDGPRGFRAATGWDFHLPTLGDPSLGYRINACSTKRYPAGYFSQSAIQAALEARAELGDAIHIRAIHVETFPAGHRAMASDPSRWRPSTRETADHSLPFVIALALLYGDVELGHYETEAYLRAEVLALMDMITVSVGDEPSKAWPHQPLTILRVKLDDGRSITTRNGRHIGHHSNPMTDEDQERKFRPLAEGYAGLTPPEVDTLLERLRGIDELSDLGDLLGATVPEGSAHASS